MPSRKLSEKKGSGNKRAKVALAAARVKKRVKFCAFDLSAVDMPCEGFQGSELAGGRRQRHMPFYLLLLLYCSIVVVILRESFR